jgi:hypothetical protein
MAENSGKFRRCATHRAALVVFLLLLAGCAEAGSQTNTDHDRNGGFYGGVTGGGPGLR